MFAKYPSSYRLEQRFLRLLHHDPINFTVLVQIYNGMKR